MHQVKEDVKMAKLQWKPGTLLAPAPPALVSCGTMEAHNVLTAAWTGIVCSGPPMTYVSIRPERYSHHMILERGEFVINLPTQAIVRATDLCGVKSGRDGDKFALAGLTAEPSALVAAPGIGECPVSLECRVREVLHLGSHDMFLSDIVAVDVDPGYVDEKGALHLEKAGLLAYAHGGYYGLGRQLGTFGFSVRKKPVRRGAKPAKRK